MPVSDLFLAGTSEVLLSQRLFKLAQGFTDDPLLRHLSSAQQDTNGKIYGSQALSPLPSKLFCCFADAKTTLPIHREAPSFADQSTEQEILVTGIKVSA